MTEEEFRRTTRTHSSLYTDLEESRAQRAGYDFELSCPKPREYREWFEGRNLDRDGQEFVNHSATSTTITFRAVFDRWGVVLRSRPGVLNGVSIDPGQVVLFPPGIEVEGTYEPGAEYGMITTGERIAGILGRELPRQVVGVNADPDVVANLSSVIRGFLDGDPVEGGVVAPCLALFDVRTEQLVTPAREKLAAAMRDMIDARLASDLCLADLSREAGVSLRTAERAFRVRFQETMVGYIKRARLEHARELLLEGKTVKHAAMDVGWMHLGRFGIEFRERFGKSPSELRRRST